MNYATVCSGIEAVSAAWIPLGFDPIFFSEIENFPRQVLQHHFPDVPLFGDFTKINGAGLKGKVQALWGSTPCQSYSRAGKRKGLECSNGQLSMRFVELADQIEPEFIVWENVKGVLSDKGNAYGKYLGALAGSERELFSPSGADWGDAGYVVGPKRIIAWRCFDAQFAGVAARRKRVFLVACPRGMHDPRDILFEREKDRLYPEPSGDWAASINPFTGRPCSIDGPVAFKADKTTKNSPGLAFTLRADDGSGGFQAIAFRDQRGLHAFELTPEMHEALLGFPPGWTDVPGATHNKRRCAVGNSVAIPDAAWIGARIMAAHKGLLPEHRWE